VRSTAAPVSFKVLLSSLPRGEPLSTAALQARGLSAFRASALARSGWLVHLARGVYMLPGDTLTREGSLAFLSEQTPGLHVGGKAALAEARELVESLSGLREKVLNRLLRHTTRIKVVRIAATFATDMKLPWAALPTRHSERIGGGARRVAVGRTGERLDLRRP